MNSAGDFRTYPGYPAPGSPGTIVPRNASFLVTVPVVPLAAQNLHFQTLVTKQIRNRSGELRYLILVVPGYLGALSRLVSVRARVGIPRYLPY